MLDAVPAAATILVLGVGAQYIGNRLRFPSIILLLGGGFAAGPVLGLIDPDALLGDLLQPIVAMGVALVVFEGGLGLKVREVKAHGQVVTRLVTLGVLVTWLLASGAAIVLLDWTWGSALLLGAILTVSGPTVVLPLLRHVRPGRGLDAVARWEGILVDPVGAVLAVIVFEVLRHGGEAIADGIWAFVAGIFVGLVAAAVLVLLERRLWVPEQLSGAVALAAVMGAFAGAEAIQPESGLVAATVMAIALANQPWASVHRILEFKEQLSVVLLGALFVVLAARVPAAALYEIARSPGAWAFLAVLVLVIRPLAVAASTRRQSLARPEAAWLAGFAPRGIVAVAVASLFALRLEEAGHPDARMFVPTVFFVVLGTVILYGLLARPWARLLGVAGPEPNGVVLVGANSVTRHIAAALDEDGCRTLLVDNDAQALAAARMEGREAVDVTVHSTNFVETMELGGLGRMWAVSSSAETNALACMRFAEEFGRANVFQVAVDNEPEGRALWGGATYRTLRDRIGDGWTVHRTPITEKFTDAHHAKLYPNSIRLWIHARGGKLRTYCAGSERRAVAGDSIAALVPP